MNSSPCSRLALLAAVLALFACATVVGAVTVGDSSAPEEVEVGEEVTAAVELESLYDERAAWTLRGLTQLEDTTWTVVEYDENGEEIDSYEYEGEPTTDGTEQSDHPDVSSDSDPAPARITVEVTGTVPEVDQYSYDEPATFDVLRVGQISDGGEEIEGWTAHHYTTGDGDSPGSREARSALDDARDAIDSAADDGQDVDAAESRWENAVAAYDDGAFGEAVDLAEEAEAQLDDGAGSQADDENDGSDDPSETGGVDESADDSDDEDDTDATTTTADGDDGSTLVTLLFYLIGFVVLVAVVGGVLYLRQQRNGPGRDPLG